MPKLFLIITSVALLAAAVFGIKNRSDFIAERKERAANNKKIDAILSKIEKEAIPALKGDDGAFEQLWKTDNLLAQHQADLEQTKINIAKLDAEINKLNGQMAPLDSQIAKIDSVIEELKEKFPGVTPKNVGTIIQQLESDLDDAKQELTAKQGEVEIASKKFVNHEAQIERGQVSQARRLTRIQRNATEGVITAVNLDWGFVVVNIGSRQGVSADSTLIVKRGGSRIADLSIVSVKPGVTVANIRQKSLSGVVQPGDHVIFKSVAQ